MELRNGDRNAISKPIALCGGATMALEVIAVRRDGFDGQIELSMEDLPEGMKRVRLEDCRRPESRIMLITAADVRVRRPPRGSLATLRSRGHSRAALVGWLR